MENKNNTEKLQLIPKTELYIEYMNNVILKIPRTEKFSIGTEYKIIMYEMLRNILYVNKIEENLRLCYLNKIDADLNMQRILLRIMCKNKWIDEKKFKVAINMVGEIGRMLGGIINYYAKKNKKRI